MPQENPIKLDIREALRYLGIPLEKQDGEMLSSAASVAERIRKRVFPRYLYRVYGVRETEAGMLLTEPAAEPAAAASSETGLLLPGKSTRLMLSTCDRAVLLIATLGAGFDALLRREQASDMSRAVIMDACGSAFVEGACDRAEEELAARFPGRYLTDRFSPGYGDLPLALQEAVCRELDAYRRLGVAVSESMLMNPVKSVTAVIGISDRPQQARIRGCEYCALKEKCAFRKRGERCVS